MNRPHSLREAIRLWWEHKRDHAGIIKWLNGKEIPQISMTPLGHLTTLVLSSAIDSKAHTIEFQLWVNDEKPTVRIHSKNGTTECPFPLATDGIEEIADLLRSVGDICEFDDECLKHGIISVRHEVEAPRFKRKLMIRYEWFSSAEMDLDNREQFEKDVRQSICLGRYLFVVTDPKSSAI